MWFFWVKMQNNITHYDIEANIKQNCVCSITVRFKKKKNTLLNPTVCVCKFNLELLQKAIARCECVNSQLNTWVHLNLCCHANTGCMCACVCDASGHIRACSFNDMLAQLAPPSPCNPASVYKNRTPAGDETVKFHFIPLYPIVFLFSSELAQLHCQGERMSQVLDWLKADQETQSKLFNISHLQLDPLSETFVFPRAKLTKSVPLIVWGAGVRGLLY